MLACLVEALSYKLEGHAFDSRCQWNFSIYLAFQTQYGTGDYSAFNRIQLPGILLGSKRWQARKVDNLITICES
jgi:hypothetical protein